MSPLACAFIIVFCEGMSFCVTLPVMSYYCEALGATPQHAARWMGLMFALLALPKLVTNPWIGSVSDRRGRRPMLTLATLGTMTGSIAWALAPSVIWLAVSRGITGLFGAQAGLSQAVIADSTPAKRRAGGMALLGAAFGLAFAIGPALGGLVSHQFGYPSIGWLAAAFQLFSLATIFALRETAGPKAASTAHPEHLSEVVPHISEIPLARRRPIWLLLIATFLSMASMSELNSSYTLVVENIFKWDVKQSGYALAMFGLIGAFAAGGVRSLMKHTNEKVLGRISFGLLAVGMGGLAVAAGVSVFLVFTAVVSIGGAWATACLTALLSRNAGRHEQGAVNGLSQAATGLGRAVGGGMGGALLAALGRTGPYVSGAALALGGIIVLLIFTESQPPAPTPTQVETHVEHSTS